MKKVVLSLGQGNLLSGYATVAAEITGANQQHLMRCVGSLPPCPELATAYQQWRNLYRLRNENQSLRIRLLQDEGLRYSEQDFHGSTQRVVDSLNGWLNSRAFSPIDKMLRVELSRTDVVQIILSVEDISLQSLPWHLWQLTDDYPNAEVAVSPLNWRDIPTLAATKPGVRILSVLGDTTDIDVESDRRILESLPDVELCILQEPSRTTLTDTLWQQSGWDIVFFAGHSQTDMEQGQIHISPAESLTIPQIKHALTQAIKHGLKLAIFNSCDGIGLAKALMALNMPYVIVMREPIPDRVAQAFLKALLKAFAQGMPLHQAVRIARQRLEGFERDVPCASWLPSLWQNPAAKALNWSDLSSREGAEVLLDLSFKTAARRSVAQPAPQPALEPAPIRPAMLPKGARWRRSWRSPLWGGLMATGLVMGVRLLGLLQPVELSAYDHLMRRRPVEAIDPDLVVVEITQEDTNKYGYPISDETLAELAQKLQQHEPAAIGLDIHRSRLTGQHHELMAEFDANQNLFLVCAFSSTDRNYGPPPVSSQAQLTEQVGFSDLLVDGLPQGKDPTRSDMVVSSEIATEDLMVRRQMLSYDPNLLPDPSICTTPYSFNFQLAYQFLWDAGVEPLTVNESLEWQFGSVAFHEVPMRFVGYQHMDGQKSQILLNYRSNQPAMQVTLDEVLRGRVPDDIIKDRIVLIGYTAPVARDYFDTPYGAMAGIWLHAHMVSQMKSAVLEGRPLIWGLPQWKAMQWGDALWVLAWAIAGGFIAYVTSGSKVYLTIGITATVISLYGLCLVIFNQGGWMPLVPAAIAVVVSAGLTYAPSRKL
ncbi:MAG: CHASE2 domain-containing protein [Elainellaceae cyanobacterium]